MPYVPTGVAAKALGVNVRTLQGWMHAGLVTPTLRTPGGHARWDVDQLRRDLQTLYEQQRGRES